jgi:hypothetical protein
MAPAFVDEPIGLQAVEDRVQHAIGPFDLPAGEFTDLLDYGVSVTFTGLKDAKDDGARGGYVEVITHVHGSTMHCRSMHASPWHAFFEKSLNLAEFRLIGCSVRGHESTTDF